MNICSMRYKVINKKQAQIIRPYENKKWKNKSLPFY
jgi:hypothetical protein